MGHIRQISLKLLMNGIPLFLILTLAGKLNWLSALVISVAIGLISYVVGDLFILPATGNIIATIADGGLFMGLLYLLRFQGIVLSLTTMIYAVIAALLVEGLLAMEEPYYGRCLPSCRNATSPNKLRS